MANIGRGREETGAKQGIAEYLDQFDRSPYRYPEAKHDYSGMGDAVSKLRGSWIESQETPKAPR